MAANPSAAGPPAGGIPLPPHPLPPIDNTLRCPLGNFRPGRADYPVRFFIRHNTEAAGSGNAPSLAWFLNPASGVSIHHLIARDGTRLDLVQRVDTAYHCGVSAWGATCGDVGGIAVLNLCSIGMEFESSATAAAAGTGYTDAQLWTGAYTEACTLVSYAGCVALDHKQIALPPANIRHDPSHFPADEYQARVQAWLTFLRQVPAAERGRWCR